MDDGGLEHFVEAQAPVFDQVVSELSRGKKQSHWMWYIFPQIVGLARSPMSVRYGISDLHHAGAYLAHSLLGDRLRKCTRLMLDHASSSSAHDILGSPDDLKFRSSMTLFTQAASEADDRALFTAALEAFFAGRPDTATLDRLYG